MTPVGVFFIYPNEDKLGFVNSAKLSQSPGAMRLLSAACRYRSWALFRSSVWPSRQSMFPLTATASRISAWALRYSA